MPGIGAPDDRGKTQQRLGGQAEFLDHEIERAFVAAMAPKHAVKIERYRTVSLGHVWNLRGGDEKEYGAGIDKAANQPWASNTINFRPGASHPDGAPLTVQRRYFASGQQRQRGLFPALKPVFEYVSRDAGMTQPCGGSLTEGRPIATDHDGGLTGEFAGPFRNIGMRSSNRTRDKPGTGIEIVLWANVDQCGTSRRPDQTHKLVHGNCVDCRHGASLVTGTRFFSMSPRGEIAIPMPGKVTGRDRLSRQAVKYGGRSSVPQNRFDEIWVRAAMTALLLAPHLPA